MEMGTKGHTNRTIIIEHTMTRTGQLLSCLLYVSRVFMFSVDVFHCAGGEEWRCLYLPTGYFLVTKVSMVTRNCCIVGT